MIVLARQYHPFYALFMTADLFVLYLTNAFPVSVFTGTVRVDLSVILSTCTVIHRSCDEP